jgi:glutathione synthase/RimK-type ligase-like ATP-grasp enzyme
MKYLVEFLEHSQIQPHESAIGILGDLGRNAKFGEQTDYFKRLILEAKSLGIDCFVFTDFNKTGLTSWELDGESWSQSLRGLPKVFYDRSFSTKSGSGEVSNTRALSALGCTPINSADFRKLALDKYSTYSKLSERTPAGLIIPKTERFKRSEILPFLSDRSACILKPRFGSGGRGIIKISKTGESYEIRYAKECKVIHESQLLDEIDFARRQLKSSRRKYIMQEWVDLPLFNGSVFDVRVIYQRGLNGKPFRTGMAARIAAPDRITSNLHRGGSRLTLSRILNDVFGQDIDGEIGTKIRRLSSEVFEYLDNEVGPVGEIGIDFLIDRHGNINLIEVNSVPGRNLFKILPDIRERSIKRPIEYAKYLLEQKSRV